MRRVDAPLQILNQCFCQSIFTPPTAPRCIVWHIHEFVSVFLCSISRLLFYPSPACLPAYLRIKLKKRKLSFLCIFHPKFQLSPLNFCCSLCHLLSTSNFLLSVLSNANSDFWPWVACSLSHSKKKKKSKGKMLFDGVFEYPTSTDSYNLALLLRISDVGVSIIMREAWRAAYSCYLWCLMQFCYDLFIVSWIMGGHLSCAGVTDCVFSFSGTVMSSFINILSLSFVWLKLMFLSCWLNHAEFVSYHVRGEKFVLVCSAQGPITSFPIIVLLN